MTPSERTSPAVWLLIALALATALVTTASVVVVMFYVGVPLWALALVGTVIALLVARAVMNVRASSKP